MYDFNMNISQILEQVRLGGNPESYMSPDVITVMNDAAIDIIQKDSTLQIMPNDLHVLNALIEISNILYNETTMDLLPLDDGIYDMLMIIVKKYNPNYQVGARPTSFESSNRSAASTLINPFVIHAPKLKDNLFVDDMCFDWEYKPANIINIAPDKKGVKKVRDTAHNYPELVGTLDKCKFITLNAALEKGMANASNVEVLQRDFFNKHIEMGLYTPSTVLTMICELKYDGISIEADVSNRVLGARSRGDTNNDIATDFTASLADYPFPFSNELQIADNQPIGMKFEAILTNAALRDLNYHYDKGYVNARNAVSGLLAAKDAYKWREYVTLVPLATSAATTYGMNRQEEIEFLNRFYFNPNNKIFYQVITGTPIQLLFQIEQFAKAAEANRPYMPFMYDGIVVSYMDPYLINVLGRVNSVNKWQMAIKFEAMRKETMFLGYQYTVGQNGVITPMIYYKPIEFYGCIHNHSSGHSFARFNQLNLRYGDIITVEYTNDVMPYVVGKAECLQNQNNSYPVIEFPINCPCCGSNIVVTERSATCTNPRCPDRMIARASNMLNKLNFKGFSDAAVRKLNIQSFVDLMYIPIASVQEALGDKLAAKFQEQRDALLNGNLFDYQIIGALGFQNIAEGTWRTILARVHIRDILSMSAMDLTQKLSEIDGIGPTTIDTILFERGAYADDIQFIINFMPNLRFSTGRVAKFNIRFTGCRDKELMQYLSGLGYDCTEGGISNKTRFLIVPHDGYTSTKTRNAKYASLIPIDKFREDPIGIITTAISTMP